MALLTTILVALAPLMADPAPKPAEPVVSAPVPGGAEVRPVPALPVVPGPSRGLPSAELRRGALSSSGTAGSLPPRDLSKSSGSDGRERPALASWYPQRPATCDGVPVPWWVKAWTASLSLPCGSLVRLSGPAGTITVPVEDRGPEAWTGRLFDLSPEAFRAVAGSLAPGVIDVAWSPG